MTTLLTILFDGVAYGMLLFVLACGLAVTLGLMNFVNLAHGAFAMAGGTMLAQIAPSQLMGKLAALFFLVRNLLGLAMGPFVVALLARTFFEGPLAIGRAMVLNFAVCAFAGAALFALLARRLRQGESRGVADETLAA